MSEKNQNQNKPKPHKRWIVLSGAGIQMGVIIFAMSYLGKKLDIYYGTETAWFTLGFVLFGVFVSIYLLLQQIKNLDY